MSTFFRDDRISSGSHRERDPHQPCRPIDLPTEPALLSSLLRYCSICDKKISISHQYEHFQSKEHTEALRKRGEELDTSEAVDNSDALAESPTFDQPGFSGTSNSGSLYSFSEIQAPRYIPEQHTNYDTPLRTPYRTYMNSLEPTLEERYTPEPDPEEPYIIYNTSHRTPLRMQTTRYTPESSLGIHIPELPSDYDTPQHTPFETQMPRYSPEPATRARCSSEPPFTPTYTETVSPIDDEPQTFLCGICNAPIPISAVKSHLKNSTTWKCSSCDYSVHTDWKEQHLEGCTKAAGEPKMETDWLQNNMKSSVPADGDGGDVEGGFDLLGGDDAPELTGWSVMNFQYPSSIIPGPQDGVMQMKYSSTTTLVTEDGGVQVHPSPRIHESEFGSESGDTEYTDAMDTQPWHSASGEEPITATTKIDISSPKLSLGYQDPQSPARGPSGPSPPEMHDYFPLMEVERHTPQQPPEKHETIGIDIFSIQEMDSGTPPSIKLSQKPPSPLVDMTSKAPISMSILSINQDKPSQPEVYNPLLSHTQPHGFYGPAAPPYPPTNASSEARTSSPTPPSHQSQPPQGPEAYKPSQIPPPLPEIYNPPPEPSQLSKVYGSPQKFSELLGAYNQEPQPPNPPAGTTHKTPASLTAPSSNEGQPPQNPSDYNPILLQPSTEQAVTHQNSPPSLPLSWGTRAALAPPSESKEWTCTVCKRKMQPNQRGPHVMGAKHRMQIELDKKEYFSKRALPMAPPKPSISRFSWECDVCNQVMHKAAQRPHLAGSKHKLQMELKKREGSQVNVSSEAVRRAKEMKRFDELQRAGELRRAEELRMKKEIERVRELRLQEEVQKQEKWNQDEERQREQEIRQEKLKREEEQRRQETLEWKEEQRRQEVLEQEEELRKQEIQEREYKLSQEELEREIEAERRQEEGLRRVEEWRNVDLRQEELRRQEEKQKAEWFRIQLEKRNEEYRKQEEFRRQVPPQLSIKNKSWKCNDCKKTMSINSREAHLRGKRHRAQLEIQESARRKEDERRQEGMKRHEEKRKEEEFRAQEEKEKEKCVNIADSENWRRESKKPTTTALDDASLVTSEYGDSGEWECGVCKKKFIIGLRGTHLAGSAHQEKFRKLTAQEHEVKPMVASGEIRRNEEEKVYPKMRLQLWLSSKVREAEVTVAPPLVEHNLHAQEVNTTTAPLTVKPNLHIGDTYGYSTSKEIIGSGMKGGSLVGVEHQNQMVHDHTVSGREANYRESRIGKINPQSKLNTHYLTHSTRQAHRQSPESRILGNAPPNRINKMITRASSTSFYCECGKRLRRNPWCRDCDYPAHSPQKWMQNKKLLHQWGTKL